MEAAKNRDDAFRITRRGSAAAVRSRGGVEVEIRSKSMGTVKAALSVFAPSGIGNLEPGTRLVLSVEGSGISVSLAAEELACVGRSVGTFAVRGGAGDAHRNGDAPPRWIAELPGFANRLVGDDGKFILDFTPLKMASRHEVEGPCSASAADMWGFNVTAGTRNFGYVCLVEPGTTLLTGVPGRRHSKHVGLVSAMIRLSTHVEAAALAW